MCSDVAVLVVANEIGIVNSLSAARMLGFQLPHLIILSRSELMTEIGWRCLKKGLVRSVSIYPSLNNISALRFLTILFLPKYSFRKFLKKLALTKGREKVNVVFVQSMLSALIIKRVIAAEEINLVDEGLSSYTGRVTNKRYRSKGFKLIASLLHGRNYERIVSRFFLAEPAMLSPDVTLPALKINFNVETLRDLLEKSDKSFAREQKKIIYIGVPLFGLIDLCKDQNIDRSLFLERAEKILSVLVTQMDGRLLYKKHPLEKTEDLKKKFKSEVGFIDGLWEEICFNCADGQMILFNFFSTAVTFPKLVLGREPTIVFLYRLLPADVLHGDEVVESLRKTYSDPSKVLAPSSIEELKRLVRTLK